MTHDFGADLQRALRAGFTLITVATGEEGRARQLVDVACEALGLRTTYWATTSDVSMRATLEAGSAEQEVMVFLDPAPYLADPHVVRLLREIGLGARRAIVVLLGSVIELPPDLEREAAAIELPLPTRDELSALLMLVPEEERRGWDTGAFARAAAGLTMSEAARAFALARAEIDAGDAPAGVASDGVRSCDAARALKRVIAQKRRALKKSATLELVDDDVPLADVGGLDVLKAWLSSRVRAYGEDARAYGLPEPRGMLLCGVQGCGKSHASKAAASVLGLPLVRLDFAAVFANASPEQALREGLRAVTAIAPVVLWVDEIEKGLGATGGGMADARQVRVFGAFLTWLQERTAPVFVAATANEVEHLPPELARRGRFDEVFFVDLPSPQEREDVLALTLRRRGRRPDGLNLAAIAKPLDHFSGAELEQVIASALFRAFAQRRELLEEDLRAAAREIVPLATLYEEKIQALRAWGRVRARKASADRRVLDLFES
ncbi:MAG: AAA family ATPase [Labilithrix sp.]|nr:AAA family ATPase [Labilithrix sp.]